MGQYQTPELRSNSLKILRPTTLKIPQLDNAWDTIVIRDEGQTEFYWEGEITRGGVICSERLNRSCSDCRAGCFTPPYIYD